MNEARTRILARLRQSQRPDSLQAIQQDRHQLDWNRDEQVQHFVERMQAVRTEIHLSTHATWLDVLQEICQSKQLKNLLLSPSTHWGEAIHAQVDRFPTLRHFDQPIEFWKQDLFDGIDAAFTRTQGGIAETGTLILWPDAHEPRLMSLVPPIHIAILEKSALYTTFAQALQAQGWAQTGLPTNVVLISGPSKSADIEQTLAYGVHGPRELVVILV